jgi:hypothetical protein
MLVRRRHRRTLGIGGLVVGGIGVGVAAALLVKSWSIGVDDAHCDALFGADTSEQWWSCLEGAKAVQAQEQARYHMPIAMIGGLGIVSLVVGGLAYHYRHPVSENDAKLLADGYNAKLRRRLGLEVRLRHQRSGASSMTVTPYAVGQGGGLTLAGSF